MFGMTPEKLMEMVFGAMGLDPKTTGQQVLQLQQWIINAVKNFDMRLHKQESNIAQVIEQNTRIENKLNALLNAIGVKENDRSNLDTAGTVSAIASVSESAPSADFGNAGKSGNGDVGTECYFDTDNEHAGNQRVIDGASVAAIDGAYADPGRVCSVPPG